MLIPSDKPCYRILNPAGFFGPNNHLYAAGDVIIYLDEPNEEMEALNDLALDRQKALFAKLDELGRLAAEKAGKLFAGRPKTMEDALALASEEARRVSLVRGDGGVPVQGHMIPVDRRGPSRVEKIVEDAEAPPDGRRGKLHHVAR